MGWDSTKRKGYPFGSTLFNIFFVLLLYIFQFNLKIENRATRYWAATINPITKVRRDDQLDLTTFLNEGNTNLPAGYQFAQPESGAGTTIKYCIIRKFTSVGYSY